MNLNKVLLIGNLTRDVELRTTPSGLAVATIGIATNRVWIDKSGTKQEEVEFHNVVIWGKQAELAKQYLAKGRLVMIEGRLRTRSWDDKATGQKRYRTEIVAERVQYGPRYAQDAGAKPAGSQTPEPPAPEVLDEIQLDDASPAHGTQTEMGKVPF